MVVVVFIVLLIAGLCLCKTFTGALAFALLGSLAFWILLAFGMVAMVAHMHP